MLIGFHKAFILKRKNAVRNFETGRLKINCNKIMDIVLFVTHIKKSVLDTLFLLPSVCMAEYCGFE